MKTRDRSGREVAHRKIDEMVVIVTGAAQGIGADIAEALLCRGASVMMCDRQEAKVREQAAFLSDGTTGHAEAAHVEISDRGSVARLVARTLDIFGRVDGLVSNAAIDAPPVTVWEMDADHWRTLIDVNLSGAWWCAEAVLAPMRAQRSGKIVFISSLAARLGSRRYSPAYAAAKAGLLGLTVGMAAQLRSPTGSSSTPSHLVRRGPLARRWRKTSAQCC